MPTYYSAAVIPRGDFELVGVSGSPTAALLRIQNYVDITGTGGSRINLARLDAPGTLSNAITPEKGNTRSSANADAYYANGGPITARHNLVLLSFATFNNSAWSSQPRYSVSCLDTDGLIAELNTVTVTAMTFAAFEENLESKNWVRGRMRRTTKRGYWPMMGNTLFRVVVGTVKTQPLWQNDLTFVDRFAWRNRGTEAGVNVNLFPPPASAPQRTMRGVGA